MDFSRLSGSILMLPLAVAAICVILGLVLTVTKQPRCRRLPTTELLRQRLPSQLLLPSSSRHFCPACGQVADQGARFCGACGTSVAAPTTRSRRQVSTNTALVDERALERELHQAKRARWT